MANILILDTETTDTKKPFCYDMGWIVADDKTFEIKDFSANVVEQVWHNLPLFESAYYANKRPKYVTMMRDHSATMDKWGYIMRHLAQTIKKYNITAVYAYNSSFDDGVIAYNCDWFKCINPLENIPVYDIWGYASQFITNTPEYKAFCEEHNCFTEHGNYSGSAETVFKYISENPDFEEEHMGIFDSQIETLILKYCIENGAELATEYPVNKILKRVVKTPFKVKINGEEVFTGEYIKKYIRNNLYSFTTEE